MTTGVTTGTAGYGFYIWGAQLEANNTVTDYQGIAASGFSINNTTVVNTENIL